MDVYYSNFNNTYKEIADAIDSADFLAIDLEFSGLTEGNIQGELDTYNKQYLSTISRQGDFQIIQFGLSTFQSLDKQTTNYKVHTYNFYLFPAAIDSSSHFSIFKAHPASIRFLVKQGFDFNRLFYEGVPYLSRDEELSLRMLTDAKLNQNNNRRAKIDVRGEAFLKGVKEDIIAYLKDGCKGQLKIACASAYFRRLIYELIAEEYPTQLMARSMSYGLRIMPYDQSSSANFKQRREQQAQRDIQDKVGFRNVIEHMINSKKPIIGHNAFLDICHVIKQFIKNPLPDNLGGFLDLLETTFPRIYDTKYIFERIFNSESQSATDTSLNTVYQVTSKLTTAQLQITNPPNNQKYDMGTMNPHEAGYDAYITGQCFARMLAQWHYDRNKANSEQASDQGTKKKILFNDEFVTSFENWISLSKGLHKALHLKKQN